MGHASAVGSFQLFIGKMLSTVLLSVGTIIVGIFILPSAYGLYTIAAIPASTFLLFQDWGLFEFENEKFRLKVKKLLYSLGVVGGCMINHGFSYASYQESIEKGVLCGWGWHPHQHVVGFILGGYKCRSCPMLFKASVNICAGCDGLEALVRRSFEQSRTIVKVKDERITIFGTIWYQANHSSLPVREIPQ